MSAIDQLYQLPLGEFTTARNALAKASGKDGPAIRALEKPSVAAWAVNQVFWQRRKVYDRLLAAARRVRDAHVRQLSGKRADVAGAEAAHQAAVKAAADEARAILGKAGDPTTPATIAAVVETLQTLPTEDHPGRLTRALKPRGFDALAGLVPGAAIRPFPASTPPSKAPARAAAEKVRARERAARVLAFEQDRRAAERAAEVASAALAALRRDLVTAEKDHARLEAQMETVADRLKALRDALGPAEREAEERARDVERLRTAVREARKDK